MFRVLEQRTLKTGTKRSRIGFATEGGGSWKVWHRFLTVDGQNAYYLGNVCQTCGILFERLAGANASINIESTANALSEGVRTVADAVVARFGRGLPPDEYLVCLSEAVPRLVHPGEPDDYFVKEHQALWGKSFEHRTESPHDPRVPYYRAGGVDLGDRRKLFHFLIPMFPEGQLDQKVVAEYVKRFESDGSPTAVTVSLLDAKGPAIFDDENADLDIWEHWAFSHFLIDGHHKVCAARQAGRPVRLLNFVSCTHGVSYRADVEQALSSSAVGTGSHRIPNRRGALREFLRLRLLERV